MANTLTLNAPRRKSPALRHRGRRGSWAALIAILIAVALAQWAADRRVPMPPSPNAATPARAEGVFTGEFVDGVAVYRLPPVTVVGDRDAEFAGLHRNGVPAGARQTRG